MMYVKQRSLGQPSKMARSLSKITHMKTLSEIFASRGDPWMTQRERDNEFPVEDGENPDFDRYSCHRPKPRKEIRADRPLGVIGHTADTFTRGVNLRIEARKKMKPSRLIKVKG